MKNHHWGDKLIRLIKVYQRKIIFVLAYLDDVYYVQKKPTTNVYTTFLSLSNTVYTQKMFLFYCDSVFYSVYTYAIQCSLTYNENRLLKIPTYFEISKRKIKPTNHNNYSFYHKYL